MKQEVMEVYREKATAMLDYMVSNIEGFADALSNLDDMKSFANEYYNEWIEDTFYITSGATRAVIFDREEDFVLKYQYAYEEDDEYDIDYNKAECEVYQEAERRGLERFFAWCIPFEYKLGDMIITMSIMEKVDVDTDRLESNSYEHYYQEYCSNEGIDPDDDTSRDDYENNGDDEYYTDAEGVIEYAIEEVWDKDGGKVGDMLDDLGVNDCHSGNWGYRGDMLVITDYAGYGHQVRV